MPLKFRTAMICLAVVMTFFHCAEIAADDNYEDNKMQTIKRALEQHTDELMLSDGVVGAALGLCDNSPCIVVYVLEKKPDLEEKIVSILKGYPMRIEETGRIRALPEK